MHTTRIKLIISLVALAMVTVAPAGADAPRDPGCDFNGDGFGDLAIGASQERTGGVATGAINVLYGSADGVTTTGDDYWTPRSNGMLSGTGRFSEFACGDFDGDGLDELAISDFSGGVTLLRGTAHGLTTTGARRMTPLGSRLAVGDFNADGADDLVVGSPGALRGEGTIDAFYGVPGAGLSRHRRQQRVNQPKSFGATPDGCGWAVVTGDFNGDGFSDVAWSCDRAYDDELQDVIGTSVRQVLGSAAGLERAQSRPLPVNNRDDLAVGDFDGDGNDDLADASGAAHMSQVRHGTAAAGLLDGPVRSFEVAGIRVAAGDFDGDGIDDLAVGDHEVGRSSFSRVRGGSVIVLDGTPDGLDPASAQAWNPARRGVSGTPQRGDQFGWAVSATDANGDGRDDLLVGIRLKDIVVDGTTIANAGAAHLLYGSASGVTAAGDRFFSQNTRGVRGAAERSDLFGATLARTSR